jgi:hypothetical protein
VKSCGPDAPTLASSLAEVSAGRWWQESPVTRESAKETVKTIARGMPGVSGVTVVTNARVYYPPRVATGAPSARHSLRPLILGRTCTHNLGVSRRENAKVCLAVIARSEATKQSTLSLRGNMDCFAALAMTVSITFCHGCLKFEPEGASHIHLSSSSAKADDPVFQRCQ